MQKIATGNTAEIYLRDDQVVKVYFRERFETVRIEAAHQEYARWLG